MTKLTWRMLGRVSMLILAVVLALGTTVPAFAQDEDGLERRGFSGIVTAIDLEEGTMTVETAEGELITVVLTEDTRVRLPSGDVHSAAQVGIEVGASVAVLAEVDDGSLTALWTLVKPERPQVLHLLGTIISMEGNLITIVDAQGNEHTVGMPGQALQGLQVGDMTTFVVGRPGDDSDANGDDDDGDANGDDDDGDANGDEDPDLVAHAAVTARQIQERVAAHATALRERAEAGGVPVYDAEERIQFLSELMDIIQQHVHGVLTIVLDKVPEQARGAIERAREQARIGFEHAKAAIQRQGSPAGAGAPDDNDNTSDNGKPEDVGRPEGAGPPER